MTLDLDTQETDTRKTEMDLTNSATPLETGGESAANHAHLRLKEGINIYRTSSGLRCGTARSSFPINDQGYVRALELLASNHEIDLADACGMSGDQVRELLWNLEEHEFLETTPSVLAITTRYQSVAKHKRRDILPDAAFAQLQNRVAPELSYTRLLPGVRDSGTSVINARQHARVEIYGSNRIAILLYGILLSSGVTYTHFALGTRSQEPLIVDSDLSAGFIRATDVGQSFKQRMEDLGKELSLFPIESHENAQELDGQPPERFIKIHVGAMDPQLLAQWMAAGQEHLAISSVDAGALVIGPLVDPGKTPCTRCRDLTIAGVTQGAHVLAEKVPVGQSSAIDEVPVFLAHFSAGLIASAILQSIDQGKSDLTGAYASIDALSLGASHLTVIDRNPACGCHWL
jgi:hypothetical protein